MSSIDEDGQDLTTSALDAAGDGADPDPYLLKDASYLVRDTKWKNKQRTLVFSSRGITHRYRHLMEDLKRLMPHSKSEAKWEKKQTLRDVNELCELKSCNNCVFLEVRKGRELYMWVSRVPDGPSAKFQILNVHTLGELKMTGNCLLHSRPLLSFDHHFDTLPPLALLRELFAQVFGTPRNHPKSKPFFDHVMAFSFHDNKIWFRHYQIAPMTEDDREDPDRTVLTEIGPRFVMDPIRIFGGSFGGSTLWQNPHYVSPIEIRRRLHAKYGKSYAGRLLAKEHREDVERAAEMEEDELDQMFD
ncbi:unnamed protein product [Vitrella brassicaformis CCMP3155]|uniref:Brix domain-containing protein n=1 Tax=Vitrella brassicaformis (strain CCMP3155) TaxID=1169540 RepID=A0A0G4EQB8_VITBC|nr:unnamed protein product [Vitrella brassicaformis CCMP3155]|mmetsp:Transcript_48807/g.122239  ORF Transcript_48807/g.122239 Transcript_48807/m.122239 type:complete len:302 (-) Transcript_48807:321-1226(-)|eukprot:CEL99980.1 unnamed protein product [Vitrella brassicaformis CCMP3155]